MLFNNRKCDFSSLPLGFNPKGEHLVVIHYDSFDKKTNVYRRKNRCEYRKNDVALTPQSGLSCKVGDLGFARKSGQVFEQQTGSLEGKFIQRYHGNPYYDIKPTVDSLLATGEELVRIDNELKEIDKKKSNEKKVENE